MLVSLTKDETLIMSVVTVTVFSTCSGNVLLLGQAIKVSYDCPPSERTPLVAKKIKCDPTHTIL